MLLFFMGVAFSSPYDDGVTAYHSGNLPKALTYFAEAEKTGDNTTKIKAIYMQGAILAAQKNWDASQNTFDRILQQKTITSYHDDALYWKAKVDYLRCNQNWSCNSAQLYTNFFQVYQTYPKGDMAPLGFYMSQKFQSNSTEFVKFLENYGDHTIADDVWFHMGWSLEEQEKTSLYASLSKKSFRPQTALGKCRITFIKGMIAYDLNNYSDALTHIKSAAQCTQKSDIHKDIQRYYVLTLQNMKRFDEAAAQIRKFEQLYPEEKEFSLSQWDSLSYNITYQKQDNWEDPWYTFCDQEYLTWSQIYYDKCIGLYGNSSCENAKLRYKGCQYVLNTITASDIYHPKDDSLIILDYLTLAVFRKNAKDYAFFRSKINLQTLESWDRDTLEELDQKAP